MDKLAKPTIEVIAKEWREYHMSVFPPGTTISPERFMEARRSFYSGAFATLRKLGQVNHLGTRPVALLAELTQEARVTIDEFMKIEERGG